MTKDMKQGLLIGVAFASLVALMPTKAQAQDEGVQDSEICEKSIRYSMEYMPEEDDFKLHEARWKILGGERTDDIQKMVGITMFEMGQRLGYSFDSETMGGDEWWEETITQLNSSCEELLDGLRNTYGYGNEFDSANPQEAW